MDLAPEIPSSLKAPVLQALEHESCARLLEETYGALQGPGRAWMEELGKGSRVTSGQLGGGNSSILLCSPEKLGKIPILTKIFQMGLVQPPHQAFAKQSTLGRETIALAQGDIKCSMFVLKIDGQNPACCNQDYSGLTFGWLERDVNENVWIDMDWYNVCTCHEFLHKFCTDSHHL